MATCEGQDLAEPCTLQAQLAQLLGDGKAMRVEIEELRLIEAKAMALQFSIFKLEAEIQKSLDTLAQNPSAAHQTGSTQPEMSDTDSESED